MEENFLKLSNHIQTDLKQLLDGVKSLKQRVVDSEFECKNGNSFLSLKNKLMLQYFNNLAYIALLKLNGKKLENEKCIQRLAELRCVFDKMKPIEAKLKYQIDKALKFADNENSDANDPLNYKPNTDDFDNTNTQNDDEDEENEEDDDEEEQKNEKKDGIYRPPKLAPVYCDVDESAKDRLNRKIDKAKRNALNSSLMKELHMQYSDAPEEINNSYRNMVDSESKEMKHREEYEEEHFIRKPLTKQEMTRMKRLKNGYNLNKIASFNDDAKVLLDEDLNMEDYFESKKSKKAKGKGKKGGKGKKNKKKRIRYT